MPITTDGTQFGSCFHVKKCLKAIAVLDPGGISTLGEQVKESMMKHSWDVPAEMLFQIFASNKDIGHDFLYQVMVQLARPLDHSIWASLWQDVNIDEEDKVVTLAKLELDARHVASVIWQYVLACKQHFRNERFHCLSFDGCKASAKGMTLGMWHSISTNTSAWAPLKVSF